MCTNLIKKYCMHIGPVSCFLHRKRTRSTVSLQLHYQPAHLPIGEDTQDPQRRRRSTLALILCHCGSALARNVPSATPRTQQENTQDPARAQITHTQGAIVAAHPLLVPFRIEWIRLYCPTRSHKAPPCCTSRQLRLSFSTP